MPFPAIKGGTATFRSLFSGLIGCGGASLTRKPRKLNAKRG
jgi:hypothetical protein